MTDPGPSADTARGSLRDSAIKALAEHRKVCGANDDGEFIAGFLARARLAEAEAGRRSAALDAFFTAVRDTGHAEIVCDMEDYGREPGDIVTIRVGFELCGVATGPLSVELVRQALAALAEWDEDAAVPAPGQPRAGAGEGEG